MKSLKPILRVLAPAIFLCTIGLAATAAAQQGAPDVAPAPQQPAVTAPAPAPDCATSLKAFVVEMDTLLARNPRDILDVYAVIERHLPVRGCTPDEVSRIVRTSTYFQGDAMNGAKIREFSLGTATQSSNGVSVQFGLTAAGDSNLPYAMWWPPRLEDTSFDAVGYAGSDVVADR